MSKKDAPNEKRRQFFPPALHHRFARRAHRRERDHIDRRLFVVGARCGTGDDAAQDRLQPVVAGMMQMIGLGGGEQDAVGAWAKQR